MNKFNHLFILLFFLPLLGSAHGDRFELNLAGIVKSDETNQPIAGALVSIEKNGQTIQSIRTSQDGSFALKFEGPLGRHDQLRVRVQKQGHQTHSFIPLNKMEQDLIIHLPKKLPMPIIKPVYQRTPVMAI